MAYGQAGLEADPPHSSLEVAYDPTLPITVPSQHGREKEAVLSSYSEQSFYGSSDLHASPFDLQPAPSSRKRQICGLPLRTFTIISIVLVVIVAAGAIGGGIAGARSNAREEDSNTPASSRPTDALATQASATTGMSTTAAPIASPTPSVTKTLVPGPKPSDVLERDCPSSNDTVYLGLQSTLYQFRKLCSNQFLGYGDNVVNVQARDLDECIDECAKWNIAHKADIQAGKANMCGRVCWRANWKTDWPRQCFGTPIQNTTAGTWRIGTD